MFYYIPVSVDECFTFLFVLDPVYVRFCKERKREKEKGRKGGREGERKERRKKEKERVFSDHLRLQHKKNPFAKNSNA